MMFEHVTAVVRDGPGGGTPLTQSPHRASCSIVSRQHIRLFSSSTVPFLRQT